MKKVFWLLTMLLVGFSSVSNYAALSEPAARNTGGVKPASTDKKADGIQFTEVSWREILKKAKAEKKIIFLDAYASWCGPCKMLQKQVFTQKEVGDFYNSKFINVKMDMEKGEGPALSQVYPLEAYPTLLFIDGNGRVLKKFIGAPKAEELIAIGKSVKSQIL
ncbi:thioredoxin family protein [Spirosoma validum]|uniref:Thioredoxin family protein n=1 Tax=Spirosoma validum TaxID=2771355 RepID=A0A927AX45_9BACT|nr:thioredoxin domain-containing protein [Spirosoma validum]MBD2751370.1 thioredoxin family protein [Spirosoma validum]